MLDVDNLEITKSKSTLPGIGGGNWGSTRKYSAGITLEGPNYTNQPNLVNNNLKIHEQKSEEDNHKLIMNNNNPKVEAGSADKRYRRQSSTGKISLGKKKGNIKREEVTPIDGQLLK